MRFARLQCLMLALGLVGALGVTAAQAGPLALIANFTDPGTRTRPPGGWPHGTVTVIDTATDQEVTRLTVGANPQAVAITPDGKTGIVACSQDSEIYFIDLTPKTPKIAGKLSVGSGQGDTFYPAALAISPDSQYVVVTSTIGGDTRSTQVKNILVINIQDQSVDQTETLPQENDQGTAQQYFAEASAISSRGTLVVLGTSSQPPLIYGLPFQNDQVVIPDSPAADMGVWPGTAGYNVAITPDGSTAIVPLWLSAVMLFGIDDTGKLTRVDQVVDSRGSGTHSVAISPDGKLAYVRNLAPPGNIKVFEIQPGPALKGPVRTLNAAGIADLLWAAYPQFETKGAWVGSQMVAVTPDGKKVYSANPFGAGATGEFDIGDGVVEVFQADKPARINVLTPGQNPIAIAIQPK
jgi:YVTN family beta-propeller protein